MSYLSIIEKFKILFDMILDFKVIFVLLGILVIATFLYLIKKIDNKKYISAIILALLLTIGIDIIINYKELSKVFDNFMTIFFSNIYFPSIYVYIGTLVIVFIAFIVSILNKMLNKTYKIINGITFILNNILLVIILNIIAKNKIDIFTPNSLYTSINLVAILEISMGLFILWILSLIVVYTTSVICDRIGSKRREKITCEINNEVEVSNDNKVPTSSQTITPVEVVEEPQPILSSIDTTINNDLLDNKVIEEESIETVEETNNNLTFDDILNGNIPVNYYENTLEIDAHDIVNPQEVFENKYKEYKNNSNIESFQDIVNDVKEDNVVIIKKNKAKENLKNNTIPLQELENNTLKENTISIKEDITNTKEKELNIDIKEETEDKKTTTKKDIYTLEDYKKFATMLTKLKDFTNSNNISIDDAVTISLINNYSIDDCLKFKEILESNLN
ncbi:MAG: hypothetical protein BHW38_05520 [Firmicutes bacterium CAG:321_26_22]|nr:MAG: hypothetical protein BHW38_05520 [Firmicutes bacterium CAG:321_26_22]